MTDSTYIRAYNGKSIYTSGQMKAGSLRSDGDVSVAGVIKLDKISVAGAACPVNGALSRDDKGATLSCQSGVWHKTGGSTVATGYVSNGQQIPIPAGFTQNQCTWSVSNSQNPHGWKPNFFAGQVAAVDSNRVVKCGYYDEYNFYPGTNRVDLSGQCSFIISCS